MTLQEAVKVLVDSAAVRAMIGNLSEYQNLRKIVYPDKPQDRLGGTPPCEQCGGHHATDLHTDSPKCGCCNEETDGSEIRFCRNCRYEYAVCKLHKPSRSPCCESAAYQKG